MQEGRLKPYYLSYNLQLFAKEGQDGEKTEEPTAKKLEDARKKGQVMRSTEVVTAATLLVFFLMLKVFGAVSCMFLMTLSTPSHELFSVLHKIHCPSLFTELMHMIYRYIFILLEVQHNMQISAEARLGFCDFRTSCYSFGQIAANLFIVALKKANAYYDAMEARCYDGTLCFLEEKKKLPLPYIIASGTFFLFLVVLWLFIR